MPPEAPAGGHQCMPTKLKLTKGGATRDEVKDIETQIKDVMQDFNETVAETGS